MEDINNSYHYKPSMQGGWLVLNLVDGKCMPFPGTDTCQIVCENEHQARSCAYYHAIKYGGQVTRGGR